VVAHQVLALLWLVVLVRCGEAASSPRSFAAPTRRLRAGYTNTSARRWRCRSAASGLLGRDPWPDGVVEPNHGVNPVPLRSEPSSGPETDVSTGRDRQHHGHDRARPLIELIATQSSKLVISHRHSSINPAQDLRRRRGTRRLEMTHHRALSTSTAVTTGHPSTRTDIMSSRRSRSRGTSATSGDPTGLPAQRYTRPSSQRLPIHAREPSCPSSRSPRSPERARHGLGLHAGQLISSPAHC
jgi:hypothetical protein